MDPTGTMNELFRLLMKNAPLLPNFLSVFNECRPCFELKVTEEGPDGEKQEVLCSVHVLRKMFGKVMECGTQADLKAFNTLIRQLSRSTVKLGGRYLIISTQFTNFVEGGPKIEQVAIVPATAVINDILFKAPLTKTSADFILTLLNHMFGTGKETHVFVVQWKQQENGKLLSYSTLQCAFRALFVATRNLLPHSSCLPILERRRSVSHKSSVCIPNAWCQAPK
jgi:hypothetical protein